MFSRSLEDSLLTIFFQGGAVKLRGFVRFFGGKKKKIKPVGIRPVFWGGVGDQPFVFGCCF